MKQLFLYSLIPVILTGCQGAEQAPEPPEICIEGWVDSNLGDGIYYERCPDSQENCNKIFKIDFEVEGNWTGGPGTLTVRNIENGKVEEISKSQHIYSHRVQFKISYSKDHKYTHEVSLELPNENWTINGEQHSYTYQLNFACDSWINLIFNIKTN